MNVGKIRKCGVEGRGLAGSTIDIMLPYDRPINRNYLTEDEHLVAIGQAFSSYRNIKSVHVNSNSLN